jgi:hypothetical protein
MPHRSSYYRGEYKNTESCSAHDDCSKLGSDSEHLKEDEFAEEDPVEFTDDVAMLPPIHQFAPTRRSDAETCRRTH